MKEEARFQIRGEVTGLLDETYKDSVRVSMVLRVAQGQERQAWLKVAVWGDDLSRIARACKGRQVMVLGRMSGGQSQAGYYNTYLRADAILVEPGSERAYGAADPAAAPAELRRDKTPRQDGVASPQQPQPMPHEDDEEIPF